MNHLRSFTVVSFFVGPFLATAHAETEAQMRARAAAEISRQATAAEVEALNNLSALIHNPDAWKSRDQLRKEAEMRAWRRQEEGRLAQIAAEKKAEQERLRAREEAKRKREAAAEAARLERVSEVFRRVQSGDYAACVASVVEALTGRSASEPGKIDPSLKTPRNAWEPITHLRGEFADYAYHWAGALEVLVNKERREPRYVPIPHLYDKPQSIDTFLGLALNFAASDVGPNMAAEELRLFQNYVAAELNARLATPPPDWKGPQLTPALAALARRAQVHHPAIPFSPVVLAAIEQTLADARSGKIADPLLFHTLTYPTAAPVPAGVVPVAPLDLRVRPHLPSLWSCDASAATYIQRAHPLYTALALPPGGRGEFEWLSQPVAFDMLRYLYHHARLTTRRELTAKSTVEEHAAALGLDAACALLERPPTAAVAAAWRQHAERLASLHESFLREGSIAILEDVAAGSPLAFLHWGNAQVSTWVYAYDGVLLERFRALAIRAPHLFVNQYGCRAVLRHLGPVEALTIPPENHAAFASLLTRCAAEKLDEEEEFRLLRLRVLGLGDAATLAEILTRAEQAGDPALKLRLLQLAVTVRAPDALDALFAAAGSIDSDDDKLPFLKFGLSTAMESTGTAPEKIRETLHLLRGQTLRLSDRPRDSLERHLDTRNVIPSYLDLLRRAESPTRPGNLPHAATALRFYGNTLADNVAKLATGNHDEEFFQLSRFADEEARTSYANTAGREALAADLLRTEGGTPTELNALCTLLETPPDWFLFTRDTSPTTSRIYAERLAARLLRVRLGEPDDEDRRTLAAALTGARDNSAPPLWGLLGRDLAAGGIATRFLLHLHREFPAPGDQPIDFASSLSRVANGPSLLSGKQIVRELTAAALGDASLDRAPWPQAALALGNAAAPILRSELDLMESLKWRRAALAAIDEHAAKLPLTEETWPAAAPKDQQAAALRARVRWELSRLDQPALAPAARAQPIVAGLGARAALVAFLFPANDNLTPARQLLFEGDCDFGRALLAAADPKLVPDRDELLRRFDALDLPQTAADWSTLLAGRAWPKTTR